MKDILLVPLITIVMSTKYKITIPEPCSEDWNLMTPQEKGRHCVVCDKVVVDFSKATKQEIINHITKEGKICGRIPRAFLDTNLVDESERQAFGIKGLVATVVNLLALTTTIHAQVKEEPKQEVSPVLKKESSTVDEQHLVIQNVEKENTITIKGTVFTASDSVPLPGTVVTLKETGKKVVSNLDGNFEITVPLHISSELLIDFIGFESKKICVRPENSNNIKIYLVEVDDPYATGGPILIKKRKRFWLF
jgi:hypothetical protein